MSESEDEINIQDEFLLVATDQVITVVDEIGEGRNSNVFLTDDPNIIIKRALEHSDFCYEFAALTVLRGLGGRIPELYKVEDPANRMMVMRRVGDTDWPTEDDPDRPSNKYLAQVIELVRDLHDAGFVHGDLHEGNVRMDEDRVYLIDFGMLKPIHTTGGDALDSRRADMLMLTEYVITSHAPRGFERLADMEVLTDDERPNYEKWIDFFRSAV